MDRRPSMPQRDKGEGGSTCCWEHFTTAWDAGGRGESGKEAVLISKEVDGGGPPAGPFIRP